MWGTIIGDIAGSVYENPVDGTASIKTKEFPFWGEGCRFTDDTVTTVAVSQALMESRAQGRAVTPLLCQYLRHWCRRFPGVGYGPRFIRWYESDDMGPYGSWANGAAMRVAPAGWLTDTLAETQYLAELTAVVTHNTEEAVRGAVAVASAIYLARTGIRRDDMRIYLHDRFYPLDRRLEDIRRDYVFTSAYRKPSRHFWKVRITKTPYVMRFPWVEIRIHRLPLPAVLPKHTMVYRSRCARRRRLIFQKKSASRLTGFIPIYMRERRGYHD